MRNLALMFTTGLMLAGCASTASRTASRPAVAPIDVALIAFNDFHGNLEPPRRAITIPADAAGPETRVPAGGAAYLASAIAASRARNRNSIVISAGDMIGASPLVSSLFLDEPTILAMNMIGVDFNAAGNHEFDRGRAELLRIDRGGCERNVQREPCAVDPDFPGANFPILTANVITETGETLLPAYGMRSFGTGANTVDVAVIGMTLRGTPNLVTPTGIAGLSFRDEAETVNALIPRLKAEGADVIVVLIHEGLNTEQPWTAQTCEGLSGDLMPILQRLSPEVDVVVSGHTHQAYICDYGSIDPERRFLVTSGGQHGTMLTEIRLRVDPVRGVIAREAENHIVQGEGFRGSSGEVPLTERNPRFPAEPAVQALVSRYAAAAAPMAARPIGSVAGPATRQRTPSGESVLGNLVADAQLAGTRGSGAQIAFMNPGGLRADLVPAADGSLTFGQIYAVQPFGNTLQVRSYTGRQLKAILEQQWASGSNSVSQPMILQVSAGFTYAYDTSRPAGERVSDLRLDGVPIDAARIYRVAISNFLATGGDNFNLFGQGTDETGGAQDLDALEAYFAANPRLAPPTTNRIRNLTPASAPTATAPAS